MGNSVKISIHYFLFSLVSAPVGANRAYSVTILVLECRVFFCETVV
jgi:hypothetical protein